MYSPAIEKLIKLFSGFPTVGPRTAARFVFYLIKLPREKIDELIKSIGELKSAVKICPVCFKSFEDKQDVCSICANGARDKSTIFIVEKEVDLETIENTKQYKGSYFILGGKEEMEERVKKLEERIRIGRPQIKEVILGLNPTVEGQNTALWLKRKLSSYNIKISQLGKGLPVGGELEYADEETLLSALESRK